MELHDLFEEEEEVITSITVILFLSQRYDLSHSCETPNSEKNQIFTIQFSDQLYRMLSENLRIQI